MKQIPKKCRNSIEYITVYTIGICRQSMSSGRTVATFMVDTKHTKANSFQKGADKF